MKLCVKPVLTAIRKVCLILLVTSAAGGALSFAGDEDRVLFEKGVRYFFQRKFEMALMLFQDTLKKNPENEEAYSYIGDIYLERKDYANALSSYRKALELNPSRAENYFRMGQVNYYMKSADEAIKNFQKTYEIDPKLTFAYYHIGLTHLMLRRNKEMTIGSWEEFLRLAPEDPQYENIRRAIELLRDPNFVLPPPDSDITIEEALRLGGVILSEKKRTAETKKEGHEEKKTKVINEDTDRDDDL